VETEAISQEIAQIASMDTRDLLVQEEVVEGDTILKIEIAIALMIEGLTIVATNQTLRVRVLLYKPSHYV